MHLYLSLIILISISAFFAYINHRFIKMPFVIGLFFLSTILSLVIVSSKYWDVHDYDLIKDSIKKLNISEFILNAVLGFLLFAGSMHTNWQDIKGQIKTVALFAIGGVLLSTAIIASLFYGACLLMSISIPFIYCLIFAALISPTDPIAVIGILTKATVSKKVEAVIVGESLFNDGIGVVVFIALLSMLNTGTTHIDVSFLGALFIQEAIGGSVFGLLLGLALYHLLKSIDNYETEVLLTLAFVMSGYWLSNYIHVSGALAMVIMGLFVGNYKKNKSMSDRTLEYVNKFWELMDVVLNAILFIMIAFVLVVIDFKTDYMVIGIITVGIVLFSRAIVVYAPKILISGVDMFTHKEARIVIWGGLRGGLSIALVLSLPESNVKDLLVIVTYMCVVFSILIQGLTIGKVAKMAQSR